MNSLPDDLVPFSTIRPKRREVEDRPHYGYYKSNSRAVNRANARSFFFRALGMCIFHSPPSCREELMNAYEHLWQTGSLLQNLSFEIDPFINRLFDTIEWSEQDARRAEERARCAEEEEQSKAPNKGG